MAIHYIIMSDALFIGEQIVLRLIECYFMNESYGGVLFYIYNICDAVQTGGSVLSDLAPNAIIRKSFLFNNACILM